MLPNKGELEQHPVEITVADVEQLEFWASFTKIEISIPLGKTIGGFVLEATLDRVS